MNNTNRVIDPPFKLKAKQAKIYIDENETEAGMQRY